MSETQTNEEILDSMPEVKIDQEKIDNLLDLIEKKNQELATKMYVVEMDKEKFATYSEFIENHAQWKGREALGVYEIGKRIAEIKKSEIKNGVIMMKALEIEATHYFLNTSEGKGSKNVANMVALFKAFESALGLVKIDSNEINDLKQELAAAQQGLETA